MSPLVHGRIYAEIESCSLLFREFRILIDPTTVTPETVEQLIDLDVLRQYLRSLPGEPCRLTFLTPILPGKKFEGRYDVIREFGGEILPFSPNLMPEVVEAFGGARAGREDLVALASAASANSVDVLISAVKPAEGFDPTEISKKLSLSFESWEAAKRSCEVFVRGHDVPWLARLRRLIEIRLRELARDRNIRTEKGGAGRLLEQLSASEAVPEDVRRHLQYAIAICNRGVHGLNVSDDQAKEALLHATTGLARLDEVIRP